jgi:hypothetical protein
LPIIKFNENPFSGSRLRRTDKHDEAKKRIFLQLFVANAAKMGENRIVVMKDEHKLSLRFQKFSLKQTGKIQHPNI